MSDRITEIAAIEKKDTISQTLSTMYELGIDHAIDIVKSEPISTADASIIFEMSSFKNRIISKLLSLQK